MTMKIQLSSQPAAEVWGENALISFQNDQTIIHFTEKQNINDIQKALVNYATKISKKWN